jgi:hypothetical protein
VAQKKLKKCEANKVVLRNFKINKNKHSSINPHNKDMTKCLFIRFIFCLYMSIILRNNFIFTL